MIINGKQVDGSTIEIDGVNPRDYPDFVDSYATYAEFTNGEALTDEELDVLTDKHSDIIQQLAYEELY